MSQTPVNLERFTLENCINIPKKNNSRNQVPILSLKQLKDSSPLLTSYNSNYLKTERNAMIQHKEYLTHSVLSKIHLHSENTRNAIQNEMNKIKNIRIKYSNVDTKWLKHCISKKIAHVKPEFHTLSEDFIKRKARPLIKKKIDYNLKGCKLRKGLRLTFNSKFKEYPTAHDIIVDNQADECISTSYSRKKDYQVEYIPTWYKENGIPYRKITAELIDNLEFQHRIIRDECKVLIDNLQTYTMLYLSHPKLVTVFKTLELKYQVGLNMALEETSALMLAIAYDILLDFTNYLDKIVSVQPPNFIAKIAKCEETELISNVISLNRVAMFLKACFNAYELLCKQADDMILPTFVFYKVQQFLARSRLNISNLMFSTKSFFTNFRNDQKLYEKYQSEMGQNENENDHIAKIETIPTYKSFNEKGRTVIFYKTDEVSERKKRLNAILHV